MPFSLHSSLKEKVRTKLFNEEGKVQGRGDQYMIYKLHYKLSSAYWEERQTGQDDKITNNLKDQRLLREDLIRLTRWILVLLRHTSSALPLIL